MKLFMFCITLLIVQVVMLGVQLFWTHKDEERGYHNARKELCSQFLKDKDSNDFKPAENYLQNKIIECDPEMREK
jgi:hypothetical protein